MDEADEDWHVHLAVAGLRVEPVDLVVVAVYECDPGADVVRVAAVGLVEDWVRLVWESEPRAHQHLPLPTEYSRVRPRLAPCSVNQSSPVGGTGAVSGGDASGQRLPATSSLWFGRKRPCTPELRRAGVPQEQTSTQSRVCKTGTLEAVRQHQIARPGVGRSRAVGVQQAGVKTDHSQPRQIGPRSVDGGSVSDSQADSAGSIPVTRSTREKHCHSW